MTGGQRETVGGVTRYCADAVLPCDGTGRVFRPGVVEVEGNRIVHVGPVGGGQGASIDTTGEVHLRGLLLPGFVNVHGHSPMTLFRGSGENLSIIRWLG
jgi:5-methylthioadenosine/S-adenosylhomocysteine deaminase